ncbi:MAG TPA: tetratricopeptide repeat protein, partial [Dissulfurispiraceae bacterium]
KTPEALLNIANCYYALGNYDEAIKSLDEFVRQFSDPNLVSLAYHKKAMAYMKKGDTNNALGALDSLAKLKGGSLQDVALLESGEMLESMGKPEDAKNKYKELVSKFPNSALAAQAKAKLGSS